MTGKRLGIGWYTNTTGGTYTAGTAGANHHMIVLGVAEANNQYQSHTCIVDVPAGTGLYLYPIAWQSVSTSQQIDSVLFAAAKVGEPAVIVTS